MFKLVIFLLSWIMNPLDTAKRNSFCTRWNIRWHVLNKISDFEGLTTAGANLELRVATLESSLNLNWTYLNALNNYLRPISMFLNGICKKGDVNYQITRDALSEEEHQKNVEKLQHNVSSEALSRLNSILERQEKLYYNGFVLVQDLFSEKEQQELNAVRKFHKEPKFISQTHGDGYWQWSD